jgi:hypothetical protein
VEINTKPPSTTTTPITSTDKKEKACFLNDHLYINLYFNSKTFVTLPKIKQITGKLHTSAEFIVQPPNV